LEGNLRFCENKLKVHIRHKTENGVDTLKLQHDPLLKNLKNTGTYDAWKHLMPTVILRSVVKYTSEEAH